MVRRFLRKELFILFIIGGLFFPLIPVFSDTLNRFDVGILPPTEQTDAKLRYYDLQLPAGKDLEVPVILTNKNEEELSLSLSFHRGANNNNGTIVYSDSDLEQSSSASYDIEELVEVTKTEITLEPNEVMSVPLKIKMPNKEFEGVLSGGIYIKEVSSGEFEGNIQNLFARELAVLLRSNMNEVLPELKVGTSSAQQVNGRNGINLQIENLSPTYINQVKFSYSVERNGQPLALKGEKMMRFAPNALMNYSISLEGEPFDPGEYTVKTALVLGEESWEGSPSFTIDPIETKKLNETDISIEKEPFPWRMIVLIVTVLLMVIVVFYLMNKNKKLQQALKEKNEE